MKKLENIAFAFVAVLLMTSAFYLPRSSAVIQGHSPLVIQGHSPIDLLVIYIPTNQMVGCVAEPCSLTQNFVDNLSSTSPPAISVTFNFGEPENVTITNPPIGDWEVRYIGTGTGSFNITISSCLSEDSQPSSISGLHTRPPPTHDDEECDADEMSVVTVNGTTQPGATGSVLFSLSLGGTVSQTSTTGVPEFPYAVPVVVSIALVALFSLRGFRSKRTRWIAREGRSGFRSAAT